MNAYRVPLAPLVTIRATYDCTYWPEQCGRCGREVRTAHVDGPGAAAALALLADDEREVGR